MHPSQLHYLREVLGVRALIQPHWVRSIYRLHHQTACPEFLFFCDNLNSEGRTLIRKINTTLTPLPSTIVEILDTTKNSSTKNILDHVIERFLPTQGIIAFGYEITALITNQAIQNPASCCIPGLSIPLCTLQPLNDLIGTTPKTLQNKHQAWQILQTVFSSKEKTGKKYGKGKGKG